MWLKNATCVPNVWPKVSNPIVWEASEGAIVVGDLEDPESEVRGLLKEHYTIRRKQELGTEPSVYYIV